MENDCGAWLKSSYPCEYTSLRLFCCECEWVVLFVQIQMMDNDLN